MHLTLHLTPDCNMACSYCYVAPSRGKGMSEAVALGALDIGASLTKGSCGIVFFGGEPLLRRNLIEATVAAAHRKMEAGEGRYHFKLTTNGLLLDEAFLSYSLEHDLMIAMSFDGIREAHDRHRKLSGGGNSFERVLDSLRMLLATRPYASVLLTVNPDTVSCLSDSICFLREEGCRYLIVSLNHAAEWSAADLEVLEREYRTLAELYLRWTRSGQKFYLSPFEMKLASHIKGDAYREERCELGQRQISVAPDGHLYPCVQFVGAGPASEWCIGSVQSGLDEVAREGLRGRSHAEQEPCNRCAIRERCNHTCGCINRQATGSVNGIPPVLCRSEQLLLELADELGEVLYAERNERFLGKHYNAAYPVLSLLEDVRV